jgi:hypothetical protein
MTYTFVRNVPMNYAIRSRRPISSFPRAPNASGKIGIAKSIQSNSTSKDIGKSMQSKPTTNGIRKITALEDEMESNNPIQPPEDSYAEAYDFVMRFNGWRSGERNLPNTDSHGKNSATQWIRLGKELQLSENNGQSVSQSRYSYSPKQFDQVPSHLDSHHPAWNASWRSRFALAKSPWPVLEV